MGKLIEFPTDLLSSREAAEYLGISQQTLEMWDFYDLPMTQIGRLMSYCKSDLYSFLERRTLEFQI